MSWRRTANRALSRGEELGFNQQNQKETLLIAINGGHTITMFNKMKTGEGLVTKIEQNQHPNLTKTN